MESARGGLPQQRSICCALVLGAQCQSKDLLQLAEEGLRGHDIKREKVWEKTIGTSFPGENEVVLYYGMELTPENLGNVTYGILGRSYGFDLFTLLEGSYVAAGLPKEGAGLENELTVDQPCVYIGYDALFPIIYEKYYGG